MKRSLLYAQKFERLMKSKKFLMTSGLLSIVFVMAIMPSDNTIQTDTKLFGMGEMILYDVAGNEKFRQTVHNQLLDAGENYLLTAAFDDGAEIKDGESIGSICVTAIPKADLEITEGLIASDFDKADGLSSNNCKQTEKVIIANGTATISSLKFIAGTVNGTSNVPAGTTITAIGICQNDANNSDDFANCNSKGILFAMYDSSDITLANGESVDITYKFDISSGTS